MHGTSIKTDVIKVRETLTNGEYVIIWRVMTLACLDALFRSLLAEIHDEMNVENQNNGQIKKNSCRGFSEYRYTNLFGSRFRRDGSESYAI